MRPFVKVTGIHRVVPQEGLKIVVDLPGERTLAHIRKVVNNDAVVVELTSVLFGKGGHQWRKGDLVAVRRTAHEIDGEIWAAVNDRQLRTEELASRLAEEPKPPEPAVHAPVAGLEPSGNLEQHQGNDGIRPPAKSGGGGKPVKRAKASKKQQRRRG
jgi:hypothetical protein